MLPLWLMTPLNTVGRGYTARKFSLFSLTAGIIFTGLHYTLQLYLVKKVKTRHLFWFSIVTLIVFLSNMPSLLRLEDDLEFMILCSVFHAIILTSIGGINTSVHIMIRSTMSQEGVKFGIAIFQVLAGALDGISSLIVGHLFAYSVEYSKRYPEHSTYPINHYSAFLYLSLIYLLMLIPVNFVKDSQ